MRPDFRLFFLGGCLCALLACAGDPGQQIDGWMENGRQYYAQGNYRLALDQWERVVELDREHASAWFHMARAYHRLGDFERSTKMLSKPLSLGYRLVDAHLLMAQNEIMVGRLEAAKAACLAVADIAPDNYQLQVISGHIASLTEQYAKGEEYYRAAIAKDSGRSEAYFFLAANLIAQGKRKLADHFYALALQMQTEQDATFLFNKAQVLTLRGETEAATAAFHQALDSDPGNVYIQLKIAHLYLTARQYQELCAFFEGKSKNGAQHATVTKLRADALLNLGRLEEAHRIIGPFQQTLQYDWLLLSGKYYLLSGDFSLAISYLERALVQRSDDPKCYNLLALSYLGDQKLNLAHQTWIKLLTLAPELTDVELAIAALYYKKQEYDLSMDYLERVIRNAPEHYRAYLLLGHCLLATGNARQAEVNYRKALALNPISLPASYYLAVAKHAQGEHENAFELYQLVLQRDSRLADAGLKMGVLFADTRKIDDGVAFFTDLSGRLPDDAYPHMILGALHRAGGKAEKARRHYRQALQKNPRLVGAYRKLIEMEPDPQTKIRLAQKAVEQAPGDEGLKEVLAGLYYQAGEPARAVALMDALYAGNPKDHKSANNLAWLYLELDTQPLRAHELARQAYQAQPDNPTYAHTLGWASYRKGLLGEAEWHLREAIKGLDAPAFGQTDSKARKSIFGYHLAQLLHEKGEHREAASLLSSALSSGLPERYRADARSLLAAAKGPRGAEDRGRDGNE